MTSNKILPVALVAALLGGTVGGFVMHSSRSANAPDTAQALTQPARTTNISTDRSATGDRNALADNEVAAQTRNMSDEERAAFRDGFIQGVNTACTTGMNSTRTSSRNYSPTSERVNYRTETRTRYVGSAPRRVYYDYGQQHSSRSFWQKHRDKLTLAMGTGGGALIGGLIGGGKGAAIGALAGGGGSALYTYKLRKRHRNY
jgi:hypothetical protein